MSDNKLPSLGSAADIFLGEGPLYKVKIEDILDEDYIVISPPIQKYSIVDLKAGQRMKIFYYVTYTSRSGIAISNRYSADVEVTDKARYRKLNLITLKLLGKPEKEQRRESYRLDIKRDVIIRRHRFGPFYAGDDGEPQEDERAYSVNISETGASIRVKQEYEKDEQVFLRLYLLWPRPNTTPLDLAATVMQYFVEEDKKTAEIGVKFNLTPYERDIMARFVMAKQKSLLRKHRWMDD